MHLRHSLLASVMLLFYLVAGCGKTEPTIVPLQPTDVPPVSITISAPPPESATPPPSETPTASATATATATPTRTPTPTPTPTHTPTPTVTPTPTPTALPASVFGDPREAVLRSPVPQSGAPCGMVDTLDFPLDPPDARRISSAGRDFGVFRSRYDGHHTGEDWWSTSRASTLGAPVYSIGHGAVTYAQPLGWGADQGVVILRHVFPDGTTILSMYGHLDPGSISLRPGDCVARGEQIGQIGNPRSPPHLHFEIRAHMPTSPGPGYWSVDPTLAGWEPPSLYIWNRRIIGAPGVLWARPINAQATRGLGMVGSDTFVAVEDNELVGINVLDGELRWHQPSSVAVIDAVIDGDRSTVYAADYVGRIEAFGFPDTDIIEMTVPSESALVPLWKTKLDAVGFPTLMPLPGGGVVVSSGRNLFGVSQAGELLWEQDTVGRVFDWALTNEHLVVSMLGREGSLWTIDESGPIATAPRSSSRPVIVGDQVMLYDSDGIYRLDPGTLSTELLYALPRGSPWLGDVVALPDGGLLSAHMDRVDRRLIALNADGTVRWQRSISHVVRGQQFLLAHDGRVFLISKDATGSFSEVTVYAVDSHSAELTRIFRAGSRNPAPGDTWSFGIGDDRILIEAGGGGIAVLDTRVATDAVKQAGRSQ